MNDGRDVQSPKALHPAFYGCYDWHSSVHGHWMLVRLLRMFPNLPEAPRYSQSHRRESDAQRTFRRRLLISNRRTASRLNEPTVGPGC